MNEEESILFLLEYVLKKNNFASHKKLNQLFFVPIEERSDRLVDTLLECELDEARSKILSHGAVLAFFETQDELRCTDELNMENH